MKVATTLDRFGNEQPEAKTGQTLVAYGAQRSQ